MKMSLPFLLLLLPIMFGACENGEPTPGPIPSQTDYFPPVSGDSWERLDDALLQGCGAEIAELRGFVQDMNTKGFMVLKNGRIVAEWYFNGFTRDSVWYWASAGKSLTAVTIGIAQQEGLLSIEHPTSDYLGAGWSSLSPEQEAKIKIKHQLAMTTGLDDDVPNRDCTDPACLQFLAAPGSRWAYHNAPYTLLGKVLSNASGMSRSQYTQSKVMSKIGGSGFWLKTTFNELYISNLRTMARFGLLILKQGMWEGETIVGQDAFFTQMLKTSQPHNPAYGYLWWLNGTGSYMLPGLRRTFDGNLIPSAPSDLLAALGKNDQKIYVVPSKDLVVVRMGNSSGVSRLALSSFDEQLWEKIMKIGCL